MEGYEGEGRGEKMGLAWFSLLIDISEHLKNVARGVSVESGLHLTPEQSEKGRKRK